MITPSSGLLFNPIKAGLNEVSSTQITSKIVDLSVNTKYYKQQQRRSEVLDEQTKALLKKLEGSSNAEIEFARLQATSFVEGLRERVNFTRTYFHCDLDMFFCAVEQVIDPTLRGTAFAVGYNTKHGIISASSYEARKFGVRSGMASYVALELCPHLKIVNSGFNSYGQFSDMVHSIFRKYDPNLISHGCDEGCLDVTSYAESINGDFLSFAKKLQAEVLESTGLTISIGIAHTRLLAKMCSDINKPNGVCEAPREKETLEHFLSTMAVRKVPGVGGVTDNLLGAANIKTLGDIINMREKAWILFGRRMCSFIFGAAIGVAERGGFDKTQEEQKSLSAESTFDSTSDLSELITIAEKLSLKVSKRLKGSGTTCGSICVKFKTSNFQVTSKGSPLFNQTSDAGEIMKMATMIIVDEFHKKTMNLRLLGVKAGNLEHPGTLKQPKIQEWIKKAHEAPLPAPLPSGPISDASMSENDNIDDMTLTQPPEEETKEAIRKKPVTIFDHFDLIKKEPPNSENKKKKDKKIIKKQIGRSSIESFFFDALNEDLDKKIPNFMKTLRKKREGSPRLIQTRLSQFV